MRVFVTGGRGFLGSRLVSRLLDNGDEVHALVRPTTPALTEWAAPLAEGRLVLHRGHLGRLEALADVWRGCDAFYHLAAATTGPAATLFMNNVVYMRTLLDSCVVGHIGRLVLVSSLGVYGTQSLRKGDLLDEECPLDPMPHRRDLYTYSKIAQELAAWDAFHERALPLVVVRPGVIYGPGRDCLTGRVGLRLGKTILRLGGRLALPYTHVENCAQAVLLAGAVPGIAGEAFNVVDDGMPTARQLLRRYRRAVGPLRVLPIPAWAIRPLSAACEGYHRWSGGQLPAVLTRYKSAAIWKPLRYSNAKARSRLGWTPHVSAEQGMEQTLTSLRLGARQEQYLPG